ncbi:hypothetical protein J4E90_001117 [Alternaria incomplexa]|uniref:uncharacterized protein n=1 Tax=Alternaria incomplexa TaxID=1187928 RepID=UPI00221E4745|nr:uncharacterized protein J4E90_001117 [Alternaria incomplexa]KAI4922684.1 hypothetical protein J4E90_001117 [Alternaria incomplexa]
MIQLTLLHLWLLLVPALAGMTKTGTLCTVTPSGTKDDSPFIMDAFKQCGQNGQIEITKGDYTIAKVMDVLDLNNCDISIRGKLTWSDDIQYWVRNSVSVTYSQRSTAFRLGGENFTLQGHGEALFFGNGQKWYDVNRDGSNMAGNSKNIHVKNATCYESGAMVIGSMGNPTNVPETVDNVLFEDITAIHSSNAAWIKTYPGQGHVKNVTFRNIKFQDVNQPIYVSPCIYSYQNCDSSRLKISDITWENITGTSRYNVAAGIYCSRGAPCVEQEEM